MYVAFFWEGVDLGITPSRDVQRGHPMTDDDEGREGIDLQASIDAMKDLDDILNRVVPAGDIDAQGPAQILALELFQIARRTFGTVHLIMDWSINFPDTDRTEDAAVLLRRLLELYARIAFVTSDSGDRDANALRCELSDARRLKTAHQDVLAASADPGHGARYRETLLEIAAIEDELTARTGQAKRAPATTDILREIGSGHLLLWRQSSDVAHGGIMGRALQREDLTVGTPADGERRRFVMDTAIAVMADTARCWAIIFNRDLTELEAFGDAHNTRIGAG